jgi:hypothetical protein
MESHMVLEKGLVTQYSCNNKWNNDYYTFMDSWLLHKGTGIE